MWTRLMIPTFSVFYLVARRVIGYAIDCVTVEKQPQKERQNEWESEDGSHVYTVSFMTSDLDGAETIEIDSILFF